MKENKSLKLQKMIEKERKKQGVSMREFARRIGCTSRSILYWDKGERMISVEMADRALKELGLTIELGKVEENEKRKSNPSVEQEG